MHGRPVHLLLQLPDYCKPNGDCRAHPCLECLLLHVKVPNQLLTSADAADGGDALQPTYRAYSIYRPLEIIFNPQIFGIFIKA